MSGETEQGQLGTCDAPSHVAVNHVENSRCQNWRPVPAPATAPPSEEPITGPRPLRKQVPEQTISDECKYCAEGEPEWSPYAKCWIHRRPRLDKRCTRKILGPCGEMPVPPAPATPAVQSSVAKFGQGTSKRNCGNLSAETVNVEDMPHQTPALPDQNFRPADSPVGAPQSGTLPLGTSDPRVAGSGDAVEWEQNKAVIGRNSPPLNNELPAKECGARYHASEEDEDSVHLCTKTAGHEFHGDATHWWKPVGAPPAGTQPPEWWIVQMSLSHCDKAFPTREAALKFQAESGPATDAPPIRVLAALASPSAPAPTPQASANQARKDLRKFAQQLLEPNPKTGSWVQASSLDYLVQQLTEFLAHAPSAPAGTQEEKS